MLENAKCTSCGAILKVDPEKDAFICEYCGSAVITKESIEYYIQYITNNIYANEVHVHNGFDIDKRIKAAEQYIEFGDFEKAEEIFETITDAFPSDYRGWWGLILAKTENLEIDYYDTWVIADFWPRVEKTINNEALISLYKEALREYKSYCDAITRIKNEEQPLLTERGKKKQRLDDLRKQKQSSNTGTEASIGCGTIAAFAFFSVWFLFDLLKYGLFAKFPAIVLTIMIIFMIHDKSSNERAKINTNKEIEVLNQEIESLDQEIKEKECALNKLRKERNELRRDTKFADIMK